MSPRLRYTSRSGWAMALAWLAATALVLAGCRGDRPADDLPVHVQVSSAPTPPIVGPVRLVLTVSDGEGAPVEASEVRVEGTMTHAGMVPVHETARPEGEGRWVVPEFEFTMGGDWILIVEVELPDGRVATREREVTVLSRGESSGD
jgi:hypothetical protein